jgi:hypothetical protein
MTPKTSKKSKTPAALRPALIDMMAGPFRPWFDGSSWDGWRSVIRGITAAPMSEADVEFFASVTGGRKPPQKRPRETWIAAGRRAGKDSAISAIAAFEAAFFDQQHRLRSGERALVAVIACDRDQAKICLEYIRAFFQLEPLRKMIRRSTLDGFELHNNVDICVATNNFRSPRGRPILLAILDEVAFFKDENSSAPDVELYRSLLPGTATINGQIIGISSPYMKSGLLHEKWQRHFGQDSDDVVVIQAESRKLNPTIDPAIVEQALADDPAGASAEWLGQFRDDVSGFIPFSVVEQCVVKGRTELEPQPGVLHRCFLDVASGIAKGGDSMTMAIGHAEGDAIVLDLVREVAPPFQTDQVTAEFAEIMLKYGITTAISDRVGLGWVSKAFSDRGITLFYSSKTKSEIYLAALPLLGNGSVQLLDHPRLKSQILNLERRVARGGHESVDHPAGNFHDDVANSALGVIVELKGGPKVKWTFGALYDSLVSQIDPEAPTYADPLYEEMKRVRNTVRISGQPMSWKDIRAKVIDEERQARK